MAFASVDALALDAVLVTDDRAFQRVPDLRINNWLRD
jgi:predicted nucleic acid-binding protein